MACFNASTVNIGCPKLILKPNQEFDMEPSTEQNEILLNFMRLLGNAERLKIAGLVGVESLTTSQLADRLGLSMAKVHDHLEQLLSANLVRKQDETYSLDGKTLEQFSRQVLANSQPRSRAEEFEGDEYERKVLSDFFDHEGALTALPSQQKKLMVILRYMVKIFEVGTRYPEKQVNEMLKRYYQDTASLRRYMVDSRLLTREKGIYWRE
jgi:hypothetical protein